MAFRLSETNRSLRTPQIVLHIFIKIHNSFIVFVLFVKKMTLYPHTCFCNRPVSNRLLCFSHALSAVAAVEAAEATAVEAAEATAVEAAGAAAVAAAQQQQLEKCTAAVHVC